MKALPFLCCLIRPSAAMLRVTVWELAVLAGHLLLYPTGVSQEQAAAAAARAASAAGSDAEAVRDAGRSPSAHTKTGPKATTAKTATAPAGTTNAGANTGAHAGASAGTSTGRSNAWPQTATETDADSGTGAGSAVSGQSGRPGRSGRPAAEAADSLPAPAMLPTEGRSHPPVLLLHGFIDNRSVFVLLRRSLRRHGWCHLEALNYSPLTCDIRKAAELLGRHVEDVCERTGHRRIDLVGHSLGGLIARYYVQRLGGDARIRTLVTLGTPHGGTRLASLLPAHPLVRQMRTDSDVIKELARPAPNCRTSFVCFWSDLDQMMVPTETAKINHADLRSRNIHVSGVGHLAFPVNGTVAAGIREALASADPTNPAQSENPGGAADEVAPDQASVA
ncbi:alpha/beta fold hydrolase [Streptomyces ochraceiscleroticus]|uniref:Lipase family alpha/beta hydrolase n=1 Tax=Streptomyces ochraceiscleroticus TaxID=47761 RepID=A0ABW1MG76_9ACTN|nr:alpha/beta fold hydrolase [Streptomyces ochraceiscleroticus]